MKVLQYALLSMAMLAMAACSDNKPSVISVTENPINVTSSGQDIEIKVGGNAAFTVVYPINDTWLALTKADYQARLLKVRVSQNIDPDPRTGTINLLNSATNETLSIKIIQAQKDAIVTAKNAYRAQSRSYVLELPVSSNVDFDIQISASWIHDANAKSRGLQERVLRLQIDENATEATRQGSVLLSHGDARQTISFTQSGCTDHAKVAITHSESDFTLPSTSGIDIGAEIDWGDGTTGTERESSHRYSASGPHTVTMETWGADVIKIDTLRTISEITIYH